MTRDSWLYQAALGTATVVIIFVLWFVLTPTYISGESFPSPKGVLETIDFIGISKLVEHAGGTLWRVVTGWAIGSFLGIRMGLLMCRSSVFRGLSTPVVEAIRPIPPIALIPFFIIWFGIGWFGQVVLIALGCFMVMTVNTIVAVDNVRPIFIQAASALGASRRRIFKTIVRPAIMPDLVSGFRIASALAFALGVAGELMGAQSGLGFMIAAARRSLDTSTILVGIILIALEAFAVDQLIKIISEFRSRWNESSKESIRQTRSLLKGVAR